MSIDDEVSKLIDGKLAPLIARVVKLESGTVPTPPPPPPPPPPPTIPPPPPPSAPPPSTLPAGWVGEGGKVVYSGKTFTLVGGKILSNGQSTVDVSKTANVVSMGLEGGYFLQINTSGDVYRYTGLADWLWVRKIPTVAGTIHATRP